MATAPMPSNAKVVEHWSRSSGHSFPENTCWVCLSACAYLERAHIVAVRNGGSNAESNLVLTCTFCNDLVDLCCIAIGHKATAAWVVKRIAFYRSCGDASRRVSAPVPFKPLSRQRTRAALAVKKARGERTGGIPLGCAVDAEGRLIDGDELEREALGIIRELRSEGMSIRAIAAELNRMGLKARGSRWHPTTVARVLSRIEADF